ncbi:MAG TPA: hypothetical protein VKR62_03455 [Roseiarcus sp.]|nr:hypothetical protein [Roseiarcus sp.]
MAGILWADSPYGPFTFVLITLVLGGAGAWATGRAIAKTWRPPAMLAPYMLFLTAGVRFLHYALYQEPLLSPALFITAYIWTTAIGALGYRAMRARQMATQYSWAYERSGLSARPKASG